ncbi:CRISPR-associated helicase Cas3', partial [Desulfovibrio sp. OttesenSCG-928-G15]|nr:CRISPR-associated helicase Cas3' [Desulfovibrio sp. OttesenSCG-928-G15]
MYYAHSAKHLPEEKWHLLQVHLSDVAALAKTFASSFHCGQAAWICGILHDIGKYSEEFQRRLRGGKRVDHSLAGALEAQSYLNNKAVGNFFAHIISAHHTGLANGVNSVDSDETTGLTLHNRLCKKSSIPLYDAWLQEITLPPCPSIQKLFPPVKDVQEAPLTFYFWCKMLFSCLIDADCLDTERALSPEKAVLRGRYPALEEIKQAVDASLAQKAATATDTFLNRRRANVLEKCRQAAEQEKGFYSLTVPTGGGKTLSSLAFALDHAIAHKLRRIIYVIPYTSIIEQTADVFRAAFGPELEHAVVEHHCNAFVEKEAVSASSADSMEDLRTLAWENWDAAIIVTTSVQFYESLFAASKSSCRKLHNISESVIILDEAQTLPIRYLRPCLASLQQLVTYYNSTVVLCTATQPNLGKTQWLREGLSNVRDIIDDPQTLFSDLKRVSIQNIGELSTPSLAAELARHPQVLCIVNTREQARATCEELMNRNLYPFHLSTWMYPKHRKAVFQDIREKLTNNLPCIVVATSLIEAGVDISFPVVYRAISGIDSIAQAAGRCNREWKEPVGVTYVFEPEGKTQGEQNRRIKSGKKVLRSFSDILMPDAVSAYFTELYSLEGAANLDAKNIIANIQSASNDGYFPFRSVAKAFKLIEEQTIGVLIQRDEEAKMAVKRLGECLPNKDEA